jgi:proline iminopeptidase
LEKFRTGVPDGDRNRNIVAAYARVMEHPDADVRTRAAIDWATWEDTVLSLEPNGKPNPYSDRPREDLLAFVRITTHYFSSGAWLDEGALLTGARRLAGTPGVLIHGRLDLSCPVTTAWELARAWPDAQLIVVADSGHKDSDSMNEHVSVRSRGSPNVDHYPRRPYVGSLTVGSDSVSGSS